MGLVAADMGLSLGVTAVDGVADSASAMWVLDIRAPTTASLHKWSVSVVSTWSEEPNELFKVTNIVM